MADFLKEKHKKVKKSSGFRCINLCETVTLKQTVRKIVVYLHCKYTSHGRFVSIHFPRVWLYSRQVVDLHDL